MCLRMGRRCYENGQSEKQGGDEGAVMDKIKEKQRKWKENWSR